MAAMPVHFVRVHSVRNARRGRGNSIGNERAAAWPVPVEFWWNRDAQVDRARSFVVSRKGEQPSISQVQAPCGSSYSPPLPWTLGFFLARILPWRHHLRTEDSARSKSLVISVVEYDVRRSTSRSISRHRRSESTCPGECRCRDHCQWRLSHSLTCPIFEVSGCTKGEISRTDRKSCWKRASDQLSVVKRSTRLDKMRTMRTI